MGDRERVAESPAEQWGRWVGGLGRRAAAAQDVLATRVTRLVVETLGDQNTVCDTEVHGNGDNDGN